MRKLLGITLGIMTALGGFVDLGQIVFPVKAAVSGEWPTQRSDLGKKKRKISEPAIRDSASLAPIALASRATVGQRFCRIELPSFRGTRKRLRQAHRVQGW